MPVFNGVDSVSREHCFTGVFEEDREAGRQLGRTKIGQQFRTEFELSSENIDLILDTARKLNNQPQYVTVSMAEHALTLLVNRAPAADKWRPGYLQRKAPEATPIEEVPAPTPHRGQEMWKLHHEFMRTGGAGGAEPSGDEVRRHARESASFRAYLVQGYKQRMANEVGGAGVIVNAPIASSDAAPSPELLEWVENYRRRPVQETRNSMRADVNPSGFQHENRMFTRACELGLI